MLFLNSFSPGFFKTKVTIYKSKDTAFQKLKYNARNGKCKIPEDLNL